MNYNEAIKILDTSSQVCYCAQSLFDAMSKQTKELKEVVLKEEFLNGLYDMSLKDIAKMLDRLTPAGGSIPKEFRDILK